MSVAVVAEVEDGYGRRTALRDLDLTVGRGLTVVTGHEGAGKSTLLALLATARVPPTGTVRVLGTTVRRRTSLTDVRRRLAYLPQTTAVGGSMRVAELLDHLAVLRGRTGRDRDRAVAAALDAVELRHLADERVDRLSGGLARTILCGAVLSSRAELIVLDEPFAGLDHERRRRVVDRLAQLRASTAVVVATHHPELVEDAADASVHLVDGRQVGAAA